MSEEAPHNFHATRWIIGVLLALVLYVGSAHPVWLSFYSRKGSWLPRSWQEPVEVFYRPAWWLWDQPPLKKISYRWADFWLPIPDRLFHEY